MSNSSLVFMALIFVAVSLAAYAGMIAWAAPTSARRLGRLAQGAGEAAAQTSDANWQVAVVKVARSLARLSVPDEGWESSPLRIRFMNAGYRNRSALVYYFAAKTLLAFALPGAFFIYSSAVTLGVDASGLMLVMLLLAAMGYYGPNVWLLMSIRRRQRELFEAFPDALDLLTICVEAGLGMNAAIARVGEESRVRSPALADEFHLAELELRAGATRESALHNIATRSGLEDVNSLVAMLVQTERFGTSIAQSLRVHSESLRAKRRLRAEEQAAKIPLKLLFPLIFCVFPSLLVVIMGPAVIRVYRVLVPVVSGAQ
jgi:tight adherence protein C